MIALSVLAGLADPAQAAGVNDVRLEIGDFIESDGGGVQELTVTNRARAPIARVSIRCQFAAINPKTHLSEEIVGYGEGAVTDIAPGATRATQVSELHYEGRPVADHTHCAVESVT